MKLVVDVLDKTASPRALVCELVESTIYLGEKLQRCFALPLEPEAYLRGESLSFAYRWRGELRVVIVIAWDGHVVRSVVVVHGASLEVLPSARSDGWSFELVSAEPSAGWSERRAGKSRGHTIPWG